MGIGQSSFEGLSVDQGVRAIAEHLAARGQSPADAFTFLDKDANGWVSFEEFTTAVNQCCAAVHSAPAHQESLQAIFHRLDCDSNGFVSFGELSEALSRDRLIENLSYSVLERIAGSLVKTGYSPSQLFERLDMDRSGTLTRVELEEACLTVQPDLTLSEREAIFIRLDTDQSGSVNVYEFHDALEAINVAPLVALEEKIRDIKRTFSHNGYGYYESFTAFDANRDGCLSREEWRAAMASMVPTMTSVDSDAVFTRFDQNGDGSLSLAEFSQFFADFSDRLADAQVGQWPTQPQRPVEEQWEREILDLVRDCLSIGRSGLSSTDIFRRLDVDGDSKMTAYEFDRMITTYRPELQRDHLSSLFQKVNVSNTGAITLSEFVARLG